MYLTVGGCVLVDRVTRLMYDAELCVHAAGRAATRALLDWSDLSLDACGLRPQPLSLLRGDAPYSMLYGKGAAALSASASSARLSSLARERFTLESVLHDDAQAAATTRDYATSHVLDWWPSSSSTVQAPPGFHMTAAMDPAELAPQTFDSHYAYDASAFTLFYVHSAARNASLLYDSVGAGGVCRATHAALPLFDANTNRVCTRRSLLPAATPTLPTAVPTTGGGP